MIHQLFDVQLDLVWNTQVIEQILIEACLKVAITNWLAHGILHRFSITVDEEVECFLFVAGDVDVERVGWSRADIIDVLEHANEHPGGHGALVVIDRISLRVVLALVTNLIEDLGGKVVLKKVSNEFTLVVMLTFKVSKTRNLLSS